MTPLKSLESWYRKACDGIWEHSYGVTIETLDNPGWRVQIDLAGTSYQKLGPREIDVERSDADWMRCRVEGEKLKAWAIQKSWSRFFRSSRSGRSG